VTEGERTFASWSEKDSYDAVAYVDVADAQAQSTTVAPRDYSSNRRSALRQSRPHEIVVVEVHKYLSLKYCVAIDDAAGGLAETIAPVVACAIRSGRSIINHYATCPTH